MSFDPPPHAGQHCRHYDYDMGPNGGPTCACGIDLRAAVANAPTVPTVNTCLPDPAAPGCAWREEYTDEERAARQKWLKERRSNDR